MIPVLAIGMQGSKEYDNSMVSRIKFSIPVSFPAQRVTGDDLSGASYLRKPN
jgi:hypothetical protein